MKHDLTNRQLEILKLLKKLTRPQVAEKLGLSRKTVDTHIGIAFKTLKVNNLKEALTKIRS